MNISNTRRNFLLTTSLAAAPMRLLGESSLQKTVSTPSPRKKAQIAITLDLEMSRHYPKRGDVHWDYEKGNLDAATKRYSVEAARIVRSFGGVIHFFAVGRVLEQENVSWLDEIVKTGHPVGNHTYDHVNVTAMSPEQIQFRFQRAPWLIAGKEPAEVVRENIQLAEAALKHRLKIKPNGFRTPGGFNPGLSNREDVQQLLLNLGYKWISSQYPAHERGKEGQKPSDQVYRSIVDGVKRSQPYVYPSGLVEVPMHPISDVTAFRATRWKLDWFLEATRQSVEWAIAERSVFDFLAHPSCMVIEDPEFKTIKLMCQLVQSNQDRAEIVGLDKIAAPLLH